MSGTQTNDNDHYHIVMYQRYSLQVIFQQCTAQLHTYKNVDGQDYLISGTLDHNDKVTHSHFLHLM